MIMQLVCSKEWCFVVDSEAIFCQQKCLVYLVFDDRNDKSKAKHRSFGDDKHRVVGAR